MLRRIKAIGLAHPNAGEQWGGMIGVKSPQRRQIIERSLESGGLLSIEIQELPGEVLYLRKENKPLLDKVQKDRPIQEGAFIAPLDNLLWDRKALARIFDFNYMWEVYKPKKKREYGYYVLPVLYGDRFVARFDPEFDKKTRVLTIKNWWWEENSSPDPKMREALQRCMADFLVYLDAEGIKYSKILLKKGDLEWLGEL